jgi:hypothetical protein
MTRGVWRLLPRLVPILFLAVTGCEGVDVPGLDTAWQDPGSIDVADDAGADAFDTGPGSDAGEDVYEPGDATPPTEGLADPGASDPGVLDTGRDVECTPVDCALACPFGFRVDERGCPVCACRECAADDDCVPDPNCPRETCSSDGLCQCDCSTVDPAIYVCPVGVPVMWCTCTVMGMDCMARPELLCPGICMPGSEVAYPCPDGELLPWCMCIGPECIPVCRPADGDDPEGWYDCDGGLIEKANCEGCHPICQAIGTRSEGWYDGCSGARIAWDQCGPRLECGKDPSGACAGGKCVVGNEASFECPGGDSRPLCACDVPAAECPLECRDIGIATEGWYDSCTGMQVKLEKCGGCTAFCDKIGTKSEGWYSDCTGLLAWAQCATGEWECRNPVGALEECATGGRCLGPGFQFQGTVPPLPGCCPGLAPMAQQDWSPDQCIHPEVPVSVCTACGDGRCLPPENPCDCPVDCLSEPSRGEGEPCDWTSDCGTNLFCIVPPSPDVVGACTRICDPAALGGPLGPCGDPDLACSPLVFAAAPGFCLKACNDSQDCPLPLTCGASTDFNGPRVCFNWLSNP